jgi:hypothetical protein
VDWVFSFSWNILECSKRSLQKKLGSLARGGPYNNGIRPLGLMGLGQTYVIGIFERVCQQDQLVSKVVFQFIQKGRGTNWFEAHSHFPCLGCGADKII